MSGFSVLIKSSITVLLPQRHYFRVFFKSAKLYVATYHIHEIRRPFVPRNKGQ